HDVHVDGTHYQAKSPGGLHPCYVGLPSSSSDDKEHALFRAEIVQASLKDIFDVIAMQDRLDGRISFLIHCPGKEVSETLKPEQVSVDLYITPHELQETSEWIGGDIAVMVQAFCQEFTVPHLHHFMQRCCKEGISTPKLRCKLSLVISTCTHQSLYSLGLAIPELKKTAAMFPSPLPAKMFCHQCPADVGINQENISSPIASILLVLSKDTMTFSPALLSLGPHSDAVVDHFKLGDEFLPKMWELVSSVQSSKWEQTLRSSPYNLTYKQVSNLTRAMQADVQSTQSSLLGAQGSMLTKVNSLKRLHSTLAANLWNHCLLGKTVSLPQFVQDYRRCIFFLSDWLYPFGVMLLFLCLDRLSDHTLFGILDMNI
ncbi:hypothetical protein SCLCIDRAFT_122161, partial [Scleroderma citrinum Foug A]